MEPIVPLGVAAGQGGVFQGGIADLVLNAGPVVQGVLALLLAFSVISWAIIFYKLRLLSRVRRQTAQFMRFFRKGGRLDVIYSASGSLGDSPAANVFRAGYQELANRLEAEGGLWKPGNGNPGLEGVRRSLQQATVAEVTRLHRALPFLATTGSTTPFIGLFGTVWGIMDAFRNIGASGGAASLAIVAPGISEALVATAAGLAAAIPAVVFYNFFLHRIQLVETDLEALSIEFINLTERQHLGRTGTPVGEKTAVRPY